MSLFKKPNRKFRHREKVVDSDEESTIKAPVADTFRPKTLPFLDNEEKNEPLIPKFSRLSFQDEEDEEYETFKLKKSSNSRELAKQRERERKKKETVPQSSEASNKFDIPILKPFLEKKNDANKEFDIISGKDAEDIDLNSVKDEDNPFKNLLQSGVIPDAATIYAMKKHRQMARKMGCIVPLENLRKEEYDNDENDSDDEPSMINFGVASAAVERQKIRKTFISLQEPSVNALEVEDIAELEKWESVQLKKGVRVGANDKVLDAQLYSYSTSSACFARSRANSTSNRSVIKGLLSTNRQVELTTADIKARVSARLDTLHNLHRAHLFEYEHCDKELSEASELLEKLSVEGPQIEKNYSLYQQMSGYLEDLIECMEIHVADIDRLNEKMVDLYKGRAQKLSTRRHLDVKDQNLECTILMNKNLKGVNDECFSNKSDTQNADQIKRAAERKKRRMRRRLKREQNKDNAINSHDGMSTDDEEDKKDMDYFEKHRMEVLEEAKGIFSDVVKEFGTLEGVMSTFKNWKNEDIASYSKAYVPLCLPKVFGVFVKLSLLDWNPLEEERDLEKTEWFLKLMKYGLNVPKDMPQNAEDPDCIMLPGIMENTVLPKITTFVQKVWDPVSQRQTTNLINLIKTLSERYPTINGKSKMLQKCLNTVLSCIQKTVQDDIFIPLYPQEWLNRSPDACEFFQHQFWYAANFFQNVLMWNGILADQPLQQVALVCILNRYIIMGLNTSLLMKYTSDKIKFIFKCLPNSWFKGLKGETLPTLKLFSSFIVKFADSYYSQSIKSVVEVEIKDSIKELVEILVAIESLNDAVILAKKYSISVF